MVCLLGQEGHDGPPQPLRPSAFSFNLLQDSGQVVVGLAWQRLEFGRSPGIQPLGLGERQAAGNVPQEGSVQRRHGWELPNIWRWLALRRGVHEPGSPSPGLPELRPLPSRLLNNIGGTKQPSAIGVSGGNDGGSPLTAAPCENLCGGGGPKVLCPTAPGGSPCALHAGAVFLGNLAGLRGPLPEGGAVNCARSRSGIPVSPESVAFSGRVVGECPTNVLAVHGAERGLAFRQVPEPGCPHSPRVRLTMLLSTARRGEAG